MNYPFNKEYDNPNIRVNIKFVYGFRQLEKSELFYDCHKIESKMNDYKEKYLALYYGKHCSKIYLKTVKEISFKIL